MLAASGLVGASLALLPAAVLLLLVLMDAGAHAFLGLSGALLSVAADWLPRAAGGLAGGATLPAYPSLRLAIAGTLGGAVLHAVPPAATALLAARRRTPRVRILSVLFALTALAAALSPWLAAIALLGVIASLLLLVHPRARG